MGMSDCEHCLDTLCCCGWQYRNWTGDKLKEQIKMLDEVRIWRKLNPDVKFDWPTGKDTEDEANFLKWMREHT